MSKIALACAVLLASLFTAGAQADAAGFKRHTSHAVHHYKAKPKVKAVYRSHRGSQPCGVSSTASSSSGTIGASTPIATFAGTAKVKAWCAPLGTSLAGRMRSTSIYHAERDNRDARKGA